MASFLRPPHKGASSSKPSTPTSRNAPPTAFRPDTAPATSTRRPRDGNLSVAAEQEKLANRNSRVGVDFEGALASQNTYKLQEGRDFATMGEEEESPITPRDAYDAVPPIVYGRTGDSSRPGTANTTRKLKKPRNSSSPSQSPHTGPSGSRPNGSPANSARPSMSDYSSTTGSPAPSNRDLPDDMEGDGVLVPAVRGHTRTAGEHRQEDSKKRNLFRSAATASSPDLGTIVRKKRSAPPQVPSLPTHQHDDDDQAYPSTDVAPSSMANWAATLSGRNRSMSKVEGKSSKTLRAKTGNFLQKVWSNAGTIREKPRPGDGSTPTTPHRTHFGSPFADSPPVPSIPQEYRSGPANASDIFAPSAYHSPSTAKTTRRASKPLPPIVRSNASDSSHNHQEMTISPIDNSTGSVSSHTEGLFASHSPSSGPSLGHSVSPSRRPSDVVARIKANSNAEGGRRRRSMSVGDAEQWHKTLDVSSSPTKVRSSSPQPPLVSNNLLGPNERPETKRTISDTSTRSSATATAKKESLSISKEWESALKGWDSQMASLEIKDPSMSLSPDSLDPSPKGRPRSRTQDPIPIPPRLDLHRSVSVSNGTTRATSVGSPPVGFRLSSSSSLSKDKDPGTPSVYSTPPTGTSPKTPPADTPPSPTTPRRPTSATRNVIPFTGPIIIGTTPAVIGQTITTVKIQRDPPLASPGTPSTFASAISTSSSPTSPATPLSAQRTSSSSNRPSSPQLVPPVSPRSATSLRVSSLRNTARPSLAVLGTPSSNSGANSGSLQPPSRTESMPLSSNSSPKIRLNFTSPSQENLRVGGGMGGRSGELRRMSYNSKNPASASEPALVPPSGGNSLSPADDGLKTIRLITSGSKLGGRAGEIVGEAGELMSATRLSSPTSSVRHAFSTASGTSMERSSGSRDGSAAALSSSNLSALSPEELDQRGEAIASRIWAEDETFKSKEKFSEWLGGPDIINAISRRHYMDHFDFTNLRIDVAFRRLCAKLYLRGESQVIDRILIEFSRRYWEHNPTSILGSASNVHQVVYSLLLLNTDLHVAELAHHMTKQQFITNTLSTLSAPSRTSSNAATPARSMSPIPFDQDMQRKGSVDPSIGSVLQIDKADRTPPISMQNSTMRIKRSGSVTSWKGSLSREQSGVSSTSSGQVALSNSTGPGSGSGGVTEPSSLNGSTVSFQDPGMRKHSSAQGSVSSLQYVAKAWEAEVENYLKDVYSAIRSNQILQPTLSTGATLGRGNSLRGTPGGLKKLKQRESILGFSSINGSSLSFGGRISPSPSSTTSINDSLAANAIAAAPVIGFASNLIQTIIGEAQEDDVHSIHSAASGSSDVSITDEELALLGAPWAKEGMLSRKVYNESVGKRAKNKNWLDVFVVIQKGQLNMFVFGAHNSSSSSGPRGAMGGGNWLSNATNVGEHMLAHSLAHVLPPPGLTKRPHCFVLTLANGMCFFFQAGTEELCNEWVSTCNYWAARQSKEPLSGGVSNMEYGWSRVEPEALAAEQEDTAATRSFSTLNRTDTDNFSLVSSRSKIGGFPTMRGHPLADRIFINDWRAPGHSMVASVHDEETQLEALQRQADKLEAELQIHNDLRGPMIALYPPKSSNLTKAMTNWEAKSQYLLAEIVKYKKYIESLKAAMKERLRRRGEKALERALQSSSNLGAGAADRSFGLPDEDSIAEDQETETEVVTPGAHRLQFKTSSA